MYPYSAYDDLPTFLIKFIYLQMFFDLFALVSWSSSSDLSIQLCFPLSMVFILMIVLSRAARMTYIFF